MNDADTFKEDFLKRLGDRLREIREEKGLSQTEVSVRFGDKDRQIYNRIELGKTNFGVVYLPQIASALGVEITDIFNSDFPKPKDY